MTNEEKRLLLIDLCAREPYHPRIQVFNQGYEGFRDGEFDTNLWLHHIDAFRFDRIEILPYLRPLSSMTEEEKYIYRHMLGATLNSEGESIMFVYVEDFPTVIDWLNSHHFDYRDLIEKGLALEAPEGMYKTE